jgi:hypothetical protein
MVGTAQARLCPPLHLASNEEVRALGSSFLHIAPQLM